MLVVKEGLSTTGIQEHPRELTHIDTDYESRLIWNPIHFNMIIRYDLFDFTSFPIKRLFESLVMVLGLVPRKETGSLGLGLGYAG